MTSPDPFENEDIIHLKLYLYLIPVIGFFPALWTLYRRRGTKRERNLSRLTITMALGWLASYLLLGAGAEASPSLALPLLITSSVLTSGYFGANIWLMVRLWQRKSLKLPVISKVSDKIL